MAAFLSRPQCVNSSPPGQNDHYFTDNILKCIFLNENVWISIKISLKFVPKGPINNIPALVQIRAWRQTGNKLLSEPMMVSLLMHIYVTQTQWVNGLLPGIHFTYIETVSAGVEAVLHSQRDWAFTPSGGGDMEIQKACLIHSVVTSSVC